MSLREYLGFLRRAWAMFRSAEKVWRLPRGARLLIIDRNTAYPLDEIFAHHSPHIMDIRGESINLAVVLRAIPKFRLGALAYLEAYIDAVAPTLILSRTDNNPMLWQLKRRPSSPYTVALIQNGWRIADSPGGELPARAIDTQATVDRLFLFGRASVEAFRGVLRAATTECGSPKANMFQRHERAATPRSLALISIHRTARSPAMQGHAELQRLGRVVARRECPITVIGNARSYDGQVQEREFYRSSLGGSVTIHVRGTEPLSSYHSIRDDLAYLVDQSTLGYEIMGLGHRVGFISFQAKYRETDRFGKPLEFGEKGPFWTNDPSEAEIERILDYLLTVSDEQWEKDSGWIRDQLIVHDYGNTKLKRYVEGVLAGKGDVLAEEERAEAARSGGRPGEGLGERG